ncbi:hypothetical protein [Nocardia sp. NPDC052112]|uniref:hypothetical protein n=1 Tax=Nocardia sp. NPDC052112 TaxID=3155646 RepID=UPI00342A48D1
MMEAADAADRNRNRDRAGALHRLIEAHGLGQLMGVRQDGGVYVHVEQLSSMPPDALNDALLTTRQALEEAQKQDATDSGGTLSVRALRSLDRALQIERAQRLHHQQVQQAQATAEKVEDPDVRKELSALIGKIEEQQQQIEQLIQENGDAQKADLGRLKYRQQLWQMRKSLLEREPAAVLLGGVLLLAFAITLVIATFTHTETPEIVASAFLLILGFFFGQTTSRERDRGND